MTQRIRIMAATFSLAALAILFVALGAGVSCAEKPAQAPAAEKILDRYVEATGGIKAYDKLQNSVVKGSLEIPAAGITLDITAYSARPNKAYSKAESPAIGSFESGTDGAMCWENSAMQGARILEGAELAEKLRESKFEGLAYWRGQYDTIRVTGVDTVGGSPCDKVELKTKDGKPRTYFFDRKSGLLVKNVSIVASQMGDIAVEAFLSDYRKVGDILVSHKTNMKLMSQDRVMTISSVEYNVAIPDSVFAVPAAVQELLNKK
jgi:zinc protease